MSDKASEVKKQENPVIGECNICGAEVTSWTPIGGVKRNGGCPVCGSYDRFRWQLYVMQHFTSIFQDECRILHFAPEKLIDRLLRKAENITYITGDLKPGRADYVVDITDIQFESNSFDYIIANHILEHIKDEKKAMSEIIRCIKPEGTIVLSFPICMTTDTIEDERYDNEEDRVRVYGRWDHVRLYGRDFKERFEKYGLKLQCHSPETVLDDDTIRRMGLIKNDLIMLCQKVK